MVRWLDDQGLEASSFRPSTATTTTSCRRPSAPIGRPCSRRGLGHSEVVARHRREPHEAVRASLRRARPEHGDPRQGRGAEALLRRGRAARRGVGGLLPGRRQAAPGRAERRALGDRVPPGRHSASGCSTPATRRSAISPRRSRTCCHRRRARATSGSPTGSKSGCSPLRGLAPEEQADRVAVLLGRARHAAAASCSTS